MNKIIELNADDSVRFTILVPKKAPKRLIKRALQGALLNAPTRVYFSFAHPALSIDSAQDVDNVARAMHAYWSRIRDRRSKRAHAEQRAIEEAISLARGHRPYPACASRAAKAVKLTAF